MHGAVLVSARLSLLSLSLVGDKQQAASSPLIGRLRNVLLRSGLVLSNDEREPEGREGTRGTTRYPVTPTGQLRRTHWDSNETHEQTQGEGDNY